VALDGYAMRLRPSELDALAAGLGVRLKSPSSGEGRRLRLVGALAQMSSSDRAPIWELATRRYARHKSLSQAAGEIGMDVVRADVLLERFNEGLLGGPPH